MARYTRYLAAGLLLACALPVAPAVAGQGSFHSLSPKAKFDWAMEKFNTICPIGFTPSLSYERLPTLLQRGLVTARRQDVIQFIQQACPQHQATVAQYGN